MRRGAVIVQSRRPSYPYYTLKPQQPVTVSWDAPILAVLSFCNKDAAMMAKQLVWVAEIGCCPNHDALLACDATIRPEFYDAIEACARICYRKVERFTYVTPPTDNSAFAATFAFRAVAKYIDRIIHQPWFWIEPDLTFVKAGALDKLQEAYRAVQKPFFGSLVPGIGHLNGTAIYPSDTYSRCPSLRGAIRDAFDGAMRREIQGQYHDASDLMQHAWCMIDGRLHPAGDGPAPYFDTIEAVDQNILPSALTFHRSKNGSLVDRLREMKARA